MALYTLTHEPEAIAACDSNTPWNSQQCTVGITLKLLYAENSCVYAVLKPQHPCSCATSPRLPSRHLSTLRHLGVHLLEPVGQAFLSLQMFVDTS